MVNSSHDFTVWRVDWLPNGLLYDIGPLSVCLSCNVGVLWPNSWMDQDATWCGGGPQPRRHCVRWEPSSPTERDMKPPSRFLDHFALAQSPISATAELFLATVRQLCLLAKLWLRPPVGHFYDGNTTVWIMLSPVNTCNMSDCRCQNVHTLLHHRCRCVWTHCQYRSPCRSVLAPKCLGSKVSVDRYKHHWPADLSNSIIDCHKNHWKEHKSWSLTGRSWWQDNTTQNLSFDTVAVSIINIY